MNVNTGIYFDDMDYIEFGTDRGQFYCGEGKMFFIEMTPLSWYSSLDLVEHLNINI